MKEEFNYTTYARRFAVGFPVLSQILIQVYFWVIANLFIATIIHLVELLIRKTYHFQVQGYFLSLVVLSIILGVLYGVALGLINVFFDQKSFRNKPSGIIILLKTLIFLLVFSVFFYLMQHVLYQSVVSRFIFSNNPTIDEAAWRYIYYLLLVFYAFMTILINFINQVNKKYGPGVLVPLLLGKYRNPKEEERIFMFMDLSSSTTIAEKLGHIKYSEFIRDSFIDINHVLVRFNAEIYQYVGDEVVVTWLMREGLRKLACIEFFFACEREFKKRTNYYLKKYGFVPQFKAGLHLGKVTAVEIGEVRRDIAYHGDTLNTASRIQGLCKEFGKTFLVSAYVIKISSLDKRFIVQDMGETLLKGKADPTNIFSIDNKIN